MSTNCTWPPFLGAGSKVANILSTEGKDKTPIAKVMFLGKGHAEQQLRWSSHRTEGYEGVMFLNRELVPVTIWIQKTYFIGHWAKYWWCVIFSLHLLKSLWKAINLSNTVTNDINLCVRQHNIIVLVRSHAALPTIFVISALPSQTKGSFIRVARFRMTFLWGEVQFWWVSLKSFLKKS